MAFIPSPNIAQAELRGLVDSQRVENTLYFAKIAPPITPTDVDELSDVLDLWWRVGMLPCLPTGYGYRETYVMDLTSATSSTSTTAPASPVFGTRPTALGMMPNSSTLSVSFRTASRGRSHRGRNYVAALSRNDVTGNEVGASLQAALIAAYEQLLPGGGILSSWLWVVLSRYANNAPRPQGLSTTITSVMIVDNIIDSQSRRLPGRGN